MGILQYPHGEWPRPQVWLQQSRGQRQRAQASEHRWSLAPPMLRDTQPSPVWDGSSHARSFLGWGLWGVSPVPPMWWDGVVSNRERTVFLPPEPQPWSPSASGSTRHQVATGTEVATFSPLLSANNPLLLFCLSKILWHFSFSIVCSPMFLSCLLVVFLFFPQSLTSFTVILEELLEGKEIKMHGQVIS